MWKIQDNSKIHQEISFFFKNLMIGLFSFTPLFLLSGSFLRTKFVLTLCLLILKHICFFFISRSVHIISLYMLKDSVTALKTSILNVGFPPVTKQLTILFMISEACLNATHRYLISIGCPC